MTSPRLGWIATLAACLALTACVDWGGANFTPTASPDATTINGIPVPPDPGPANDATLAGIDANHNGVRDDVERAIAEKYGTNIPQWKAEMQLAASMQAETVADGQNPQAAQANASAVRAGDCEALTFFGPDTSQDVRALEFVFYLTVDTPQRYNAFETTASLDTPYQNIPDNEACTWPSP